MGRGLLISAGSARSARSAGVQEDGGASTEQSPLQLTLHRRRPMGRGGRGSSSGQTSALLPVLFQEMRDARCFYAGNRTARTNRHTDVTGDGDATIVKFQRKFIACIFLSSCFFSVFTK